MAEERPDDPLVDRAAKAVLDNVSVLARRLRQRPVTGELTQPEVAALARLSREAPTTTAALARGEHVRPQSMGAVVVALEARGLVQRNHDPADGRRVMLRLTRTGRAVSGSRRSGRTEQLARALSSGFSEQELEQLVAVAPLLGRVAARLD